jgi:uncharacterized membrane protein
LALLILLVAPSAALAQVGGRGGVRQMQSRSQLEARVYQRFLEQSGREIGLSSTERSRLARWLNDSQANRRELSADAAAVRRRLLDAVADPQTTDAEFETVLRDLNRLRDREHDLWQNDQRELEQLLPPRKRAQFVVRFLRLQDAVRDLIQQRDSAAGPRGGPPLLPGEDDAIAPVTIRGGNPFLGGQARNAERGDAIRAGAGRAGRPPIF